MEKVISLHIEKLPEGTYLATSDDLPGLLAEGRTVFETVEIARDVAAKLMQAQAQRRQQASLAAVQDSFDYPLIIAT